MYYVDKYGNKIPAPKTTKRKKMNIRESYDANANATTSSNSNMNYWWIILTIIILAIIAFCLYRWYNCKKENLI